MRRWPVTLGMALVAVLVAVACQPDLEKQSQLLGRVRLLALRAEPPEADLRDAGLPSPITFAPLAYPDAGLAFRLALCGPGNPFSADFDCPGSNGLDLPDLVLDGSRPEIQAFLQAAFGSVGGLDGGINVGEPGVAQVAIGYQLERPDAGPDPSNRERGIYRLAVRFSGQPNHNPELLDVTLPDGGPLQGAVFPLDQEIRLYPHIPDGGHGGSRGARHHGRKRRTARLPRHRLPGSRHPGRAAPARSSLVTRADRRPTCHASPSSSRSRSA